MGKESKKKNTSFCSNNKITEIHRFLFGAKKTNKKPQPKTKDRDLLIVEEEMSESFGHKVEIEAKNKKSGKVVINYSTQDELESIISKLKN